MRSYYFNKFLTAKTPISPAMTLQVLPPMPSFAMFTDELITSDEKALMAVHEATETSVSPKILAIIYEYALNKFADTAEIHAAGIPKFLAVIDKFVMAGKQVEMCLPAFPFKSANKVYKVLGLLPDKAEELALERLNTMCARIREVYGPGARLTIISDGLVYNGM